MSSSQPPASATSDSTIVSSTKALGRLVGVVHFLHIIIQHYQARTQGGGGGGGGRGGGSTPPAFWNPIYTWIYTVYM